MSKRLTGLNPLAYMGVEPSMPPNMYMSPDSPTPTDVYNFNLGDFWVNTDTKQLWVLVSQQRGVAKWITLFGGAADSFVTDSGTATPSGGVLNLNGDGVNINTIGSGNTVQIHANTNPTLTGLTLTGFTGGVLVSNGSGVIGEVATTNHSLLVGNAAGTITNLGVATNGQIPIGSTGANPVLATITAGTGITVTNGAGSITIGSTGAGLAFDGNTGSATESGGIVNIVGTGGLSTSASGNTVTISGNGTVPQVATITLTSAQVKALQATPIQIVPAQGANTIISPLISISFLSYGGNNAFVAPASLGAIILYYTNNNSSGFIAGPSVSSNCYQQTQNGYLLIAPTGGAAIATSSIVNQPMYVALDQSASGEITGNAAGDNTLTIQLQYDVISVPL